MTTITSAALINATTETEVNIDAENRDITLNLAGNLSADGVTLQALYSYLKKAWRIQTFDIGSSGASAGDVINLDDTTNVLPGMAVALKSGTGTIDAGTVVVSVDSATAITVTTGNISVALDGTSEITFTNHLIEYPFPLVAITPEQFEWSFDWTPSNALSRQLLRTAGWREITTAGLVTAEYVGVISLGNIDGTPTGGGDKVYYAYRAAAKKTNGFTFSATQITGAAGDFDSFGNGDVVNISGSTGNDGIYTITTAATGSLTFPGATFSTTGLDSATVTIRKINYEAEADFTYAGAVNEAIQTFDGTTDNRTNELAIFIREDGKTFDKSDTPAIGIATGDIINYQVFRFPLAESTDNKYTVNDAAIELADGAGEFYDIAPGNGPEINFLAADVGSNTLYTTDLLSGPFNFGVTIDATAGDGNGTNSTGALTTEQLYSWVKYRLRRPTSDGTVDDEGADSVVQIGKTSDELLEFVGDTLQTKRVENADNTVVLDGVAIINFADGDIGNLRFRSTTNDTLQRFPSISSGQIQFNDNLKEDAAGTFTMYFTYTRQYSVADLTWTQGAGSSGTLTGAGTLPVTTTGDYIDVSGFAGSGNEPNLNGVYLITDATSTSSIDVTRIDDLVLPASDTVTTTTNNFRFNPVNSPDAIVVVDKDDNEIRGTTLVDFNYSFKFDQDLSPASGNTAENRLATEPANVSIRAVGTDKAQWVNTPFVITNNSGLNISVNAPLERNYAP